MGEVLATIVEEAGLDPGPGPDLEVEDPGPGPGRDAGHPLLRGAGVAAAAAPDLPPNLPLDLGLGRWKFVL